MNPPFKEAVVVEIVDSVTVNVLVVVPYEKITPPFVPWIVDIEVPFYIAIEAEEPNI